MHLRTAYKYNGNLLASSRAVNLRRGCFECWRAARPRPGWRAGAHTLLRRLCWFFAGLALAQGGAAEPALRVIYTVDRPEFAEIIQEYARGKPLKIEAEFISQNRLKEGITAMVEKNTLPDMLILPADHLGLHSLVKYSAIARDQFKVNAADNIWQGGHSEGSLYGVPVLQGNQLVLYYNKKLVDKPAANWRQLREQNGQFDRAGIITITWSYNEPFWFLPFLGAFGGGLMDGSRVTLDSAAMVQALDFYKNLRDTKLVDEICNNPCVEQDFVEGKAAYVIHGNWIGKAFYEALGDNLGVEAIPAIDDKPVVGTFLTTVIAFPGNSLASKKAPALTAFTNYLLSPEVQKDLWRRAAIFPVDSEALAYAKANANGYLKRSLELIGDAKALPSEPEVTLVWDAVYKGILYHQDGTFSAGEAATYMQRLAERNIRNVRAAAAEAQAALPQPTK